MQVPSISPIMLQNNRTEVRGLKQEPWSAAAAQARSQGPLSAPNHDSHRWLRTLPHSPKKLPEDLQGNSKQRTFKMPQNPCSQLLACLQWGSSPSASCSEARPRPNSTQVVNGDDPQILLNPPQKHVWRPAVKHVLHPQGQGALCSLSEPHKRCVHQGEPCGCRS